MKFPEPILKVFLKAYAAELVEMAYRGILMREADSTGLSAYAESLGKTADLTGLLTELCTSDEQWERTIAARAHDLVRIVYRGLLGREPDPDALGSYERRLAEDNDLATLLTDIGGSDELWQKSISARAEELVRIVYQGLLGREPELAALESYTTKLSECHDLTPLLSEIASSDEHWEKTLDVRAPDLVRIVYQALLGREPEPAALESYTAKLSECHDLTPLLSEIASSDEHWEKTLDVRAPDLVRTVYQGLLGREPEPEALKSYTAKLSECHDLTPLLSKIASSDELWEKLLAARSGNLVRKVSEPMLHLSTLNMNVPTIILVEGWYGLENGFCWSKKTSSIILTSSTKVYLTTNVRPNSSFKVKFEYASICRTITIEDSFSTVEVDFKIEQPTLVKFDVISFDEDLHPDSRELAFQLWPLLPPNYYIKTPETLIFVHVSKKEADSLKPVFDKFCQDDSAAQILPANSVIKLTKTNRLQHFIFVIASATCYAKLHNAGLKGTFVYLEHGVAPLKRYTYAGHYKQYHYSLLPGDLWRDRLVELYPELGRNCFTVGFPKLQKKEVTTEERDQFCERFGFDREEKIVLFAPSWSGGKRDSGIFNISFFDRTINLLAIPHDGDVQFSDEITKNGWSLCVLKDGESISNYYAFADILVSDVSSTAIEFMALGKPSICLRTHITTDFDPRYQTIEGDITIPYTSYKWDFCPVIDNSQISVELHKMVASIDDRSVPIKVPDLVTKMCACYGEEASERCVTLLKQIINKTHMER